VSEGSRSRSVRGRYRTSTHRAARRPLRGRRTVERVPPSPVRGNARLLHGGQAMRRPAGRSRPSARASSPGEIGSMLTALGATARAAIRQPGGPCTHRRDSAAPALRSAGARARTPARKRQPSTSRCILGTRRATLSVHRAPSHAPNSPGAVTDRLPIVSCLRRHDTGHRAGTWLTPRTVRAGHANRHTVRTRHSHLPRTRGTA